MPSLKDYHGTKLIKMLLIGDSGSGKTGALASLAKAGYNLFIADFDNGLDILPQLLRDDPEALARVQYETFTEEMKGTDLGAYPKSARAFGKAMKTLSNWPDKGPLESWTDQDVLVIDSLTMACNVAMNQAKMADGKLYAKTEIQHWGWAMSSIESMLALLASQSTNCNVIVLAHITHIESEYGGVIKGFPNALGQKLPPKVPAYFNTALQVRTKGSGKNVVRQILTRSEGLVELKTPIFKRVPDVLPIETGLADFFKLYKEHTNA